MNNVTFDEFKKLDLRVVEIKEVEDVEGADRIYRLNVDIGPPAGEAGEPRTIRGVESHGMLFAASTPEKEKLTLVTVDRDIPNGSKVS